MRSGWAVYPNHLVRAVRQTRNRCINSVCLSGEIRIERAENDAAVAFLTGPYGASGNAGDYASTGCAAVMMRTQELRGPAPKRWHFPLRATLVHHGRAGAVRSRPAARCFRWNKTAPLSRLVIAYLEVYFSRMRARVVPGVYQVFCAKCRISGEQNLFGHAIAPRVFQQPYRNSRPYDTRFSATDLGAGFDAGECIPKVLYKPLENLSLLRGRQFDQNVLEFAQARHLTNSIVPQSAASAKAGANLQSGDQEQTRSWGKTIADCTPTDQHEHWRVERHRPFAFTTLNTEPMIDLRIDHPVLELIAAEDESTLRAIDEGIAQLDGGQGIPLEALRQELARRYLKVIVSPRARNDSFPKSSD
ncbi:MAG TPA: hypothetical protein VG297_13860 [Bryobacteraceae bacterium]|nr:hypothetical protein [Bryobacteraceae bacterium]